jgi:hypothetical protein
VDTVSHFVPNDEHDGTVPLLTYVGESGKTAKEHLADNYSSNRDTTGKALAKAWLAMQLANGPRWSAHIHLECGAEGISEKKLNAAKKELKVKSSRVGSSGPWFMSLPEHEGQTPEGPDPRDDDQQTPEDDESGQEQAEPSRVSCTLGVL